MYRHAMWVDTIYHIPPFYALLAQLSGEARYYDEAIHEWECHTRWLSSPEGPFLCHGVDTGNNLLKGYGWGRGTGWAVLGMVDTLELLPYEHPRYNWALDQFQALAAEVDKVQDDSGFWHTLLHDKEAYLEASTAAFFGSAFTKAMRLGLLDNDYIDVTERAWQACKSRLRSNGSFTGVSECTWAGITPDDSAVIYKTVPTGVNIWGQGSALRFVAERIHAGQDIY